MELKLPREIADAVRALAMKSGVSAEQLVVNALRAHFPPPPKELQEELDAWELASDEDWASIQRHRACRRVRSGWSRCPWCQVVNREESGQL